MTTSEAVNLSGPEAYHGEGPMWDDKLGALLWLDMLAGCVLRTDLSGATRRYPVGSPVAALVRPTSDGRHIVATERGLSVIDFREENPTAIGVVDLDLPASLRCNEGVVAGDGGLYLGVMNYDETARSGMVLHISPQGSVVRALSECSVPNGTHMVDRETVLFIDSPRRAVMRYLVNDEGAWINPEIVVDMSHWVGVPDGMCVDVEGGMWIAHWDGHEVVRFAPDGSIDRTIGIPTRRPTSCALGGPDGCSIFITTSAYRLDREKEPQAGSLFVATVAVPAGPQAPCFLLEPSPPAATER